MKSFFLEVSVANTFQQAEVRPVDIEYRKVAGQIEADYRLELVTLSDMPARCFRSEVVEDVLSQARHDAWLQGEIADYLHVDGLIDDDQGYEAKEERRMTI